METPKKTDTAKVPTKQLHVEEPTIKTSAEKNRPDLSEQEKVVSKGSGYTEDDTLVLSKKQKKAEVQKKGSIIDSGMSWLSRALTKFTISEQKPLFDKNGAIQVKSGDLFNLAQNFKNELFNYAHLNVAGDGSCWISSTAIKFFRDVLDDPNKRKRTLETLDRIENRFDQAYGQQGKPVVEKMRDLILTLAGGHISERDKILEKTENINIVRNFVRNTINLEALNHPNEFKYDIEDLKDPSGYGTENLIGTFLQQFGLDGHIIDFTQDLPTLSLLTSEGVELVSNPLEVKNLLAQFSRNGETLIFKEKQHYSILEPVKK